MSARSPRFVLVAGEASGDQLGGPLIRELKSRFPRSTFAGIGGEAMRSEGMDAWWDYEELAVMGLFEVLKHFPRLVGIRRALRRRVLTERPDVFIGIDAPDFNIGLEKSLRKAGIRTVHYVSPTVWAWREKRVKKVARAADLVLCLFPFEPRFYAGLDVSAVYVGHPMADHVLPDADRASARSALGIPESGTVVALLPGSRSSEIGRLAEPMLDAAARLAQRDPATEFVAAMASERLRAEFENLYRAGDYPAVRIVVRRSRDAITACDVVICASGSATLEVMLVNRPMVVAYRISEPTYRLAKALKLISTRHIAMANIVAGERLVPELLQHEATGERMAEEVSTWLGDADRRAALTARFAELQSRLRCGASEQAAHAISQILEPDP